MAFNLIAKCLDNDSGGEQIVVINEKTATDHGINPGDHIIISRSFKREIICIVNTSKDGVGERDIGIYKRVCEKYELKEGSEILVTLFEKPDSVEYIKKKIKRYSLNYDELKAIMKDIVDGKLGDIEKTYFLSTVYNPGYNDDELYSLTKAMSDTGEVISFDGIVADKHSIGGIVGKGITPLVVSIVSSFGIKVPNTSTRSITTPDGTTDMLETISPMDYNASKVKDFITQENACMVWGGGVNIAPADDELIRIERPMGIESYDKFLVSIVAKKVAIGVNHLLVDLPAGPEGKVSNMNDIAIIKEKFARLCAKFGIKVVVSERVPNSIDGNAAGPKLEMREVLYVFENHANKSTQLESEAIRLAGILLEMTGIAKEGEGKTKAAQALSDGSAYTKFRRIIQMQGGNAQIKSSDLDPKVPSLSFESAMSGEIKTIHNKKVIQLARILGCPLDKSAGVYFYKKPGDTIDKKHPMFSIYATSQERLQLGVTFMQKNHLFEIG